MLTRTVDGSKKRLSPRKGTKGKTLKLCCLLLSLVVLISFDANADTTLEKYQTPRFTLYFSPTYSNKNEISKVNTALAAETMKFMDQTHNELVRVLGEEPEEKIVLKLLSPKDFHKHTGAPTWTSAMYYKGEISAPINPHRVNKSELKKALKHEYVHHFVASISKQKCPAWFDEGLAQLIEGEPNSLLGPALRRWTRSNNPLPLSWLDEGFMNLSRDLVPVAYAQSLFAVRALVNEHGMESVREYLNVVNETKSPKDAFKWAFGETQKEFEKSLVRQIARWRGSSRPHP